MCSSFLSAVCDGRLLSHFERALLLNNYFGPHRVPLFTTPGDGASLLYTVLHRLPLASSLLHTVLHRLRRAVAEPYALERELTEHAE